MVSSLHPGAVFQSGIKGDEEGEWCGSWIDFFFFVVVVGKVNSEWGETHPCVYCGLEVWR
jgi:hypothetical protein